MPNETYNRSRKKTIYDILKTKSKNKRKAIRCFTTHRNEYFLFIPLYRKLEGGMKYPKYPILYSKERRRDERGEREIKLSSMQKGAPFKKILKATKGAWKEG